MDSYTNGDRRGGGGFGPKKFGGGGNGSRFGGGNRGGFSGGRDRGGDRGGFGGERPPMQMHKATCASCGKSCEVPFRPSGDRPVYCNDCFGSSSDTRAPQKSFDNKSFDKRFDREPAREPVKTNPLKQEIMELNMKLDTIIKLLGGSNNASPKKEMKEIKESPVAVVAEKKSEAKETKKIAKKIAKKETVKADKKKAPAKPKTASKKK